MFEEAFDFIEFVNCDFNQLTCQSNGVTGYPAWFFNGAPWAEGVQTFDAFSEISGCPLPEGMGDETSEEALSEVQITP